MTIRRGLTLGKYAPLHTGHQFVIDTALSEMDEVVVLIYDSPEVTDVPLEARSTWLRDLYPAIDVIEVRGAPAEVGYAEALKKRHEDAILCALKGVRISHFYSCEPYGEHVSRVLGAIDRRVEPYGEARVSATAIRSDPHACREQVPARVYRDLITRVVFLGAPSTGKTTLARRLAVEFNTAWMPEYGREYWERHQVERRLSPGQLTEVAVGHLHREDERILDANRYLFVDTNALTTCVFSRYYHGFVPQSLPDIARHANGRYDLVFVCDTDIDYDDTPDRSGDANRRMMQGMILDDLRDRAIAYRVLRGSISQRVAAVSEALDGYRKYDLVCS